MRAEPTSRTEQRKAVAPILGLAQSAQRNVMFIEVAFRGAKNRPAGSMEYGNERIEAALSLGKVLSRRY